MATTQQQKEARAATATSPAAAAAVAPLPTAVNFAVGMASGVSGWLFVHPADVVKVRMQLSGGGKEAGAGMVTTARGILKQEGFSGLYSGLSAAIARQMSYTTLRLGFFDEIKGQLAQRQIKETGVTRSMSAMTAGALASFLACPVEVCLVRMQADGKLPPAEQRGYKHVGDALLRVAQEEGVLTYWRGAGPTVLRAMVVSTTQLGTYDQAKVSFHQMGMPDGPGLHLLSSLTAGLVYSLASLPLDTAKTRMQTQAAPKPGEQLLYRSTAQTLMKIASEEGVPRLWKGFGAYFLRGGGHTVFMFLFYEQYKALARKLCS